MKSGQSRLALLGCTALLAWAVMAGPLASPARGAQKPEKQPAAQLSKFDKHLLQDITWRAWRYFWEQTDPHTGLVLDRAPLNGGKEDDPQHRDVASIAATGFGLTADCIGAEHRWISKEVARQRILTTLRYFAYRAPQEHGWFYHFVDARTGKRRWKSEVSSIDTALLLAGVLTARQAFPDDAEINRLATLIYDRVDFPWMMNGSKEFLSHGWRPETGFIPYRWDSFSEAAILYLLAIGSPTHSISPAAWYAWKLPVVDDSGYTFIGGGPIFIQQYSQAWLDLRNYVYAKDPLLNRFVPRVNLFANAVEATRAERAAALDLAHRFPGYSANVWGVTSSDSAKGYVAWGGTLRDSKIDGTVVPSAAAGSLMFAPDICIPALRAMLLQYGKKIYGRYGFADAFNPNTGWVSHYVIGIDQGITLLSAEDLHSGDVWNWFMSNPDIQRSLYFVGLLARTPPPSNAKAQDQKDKKKPSQVAESGVNLHGYRDHRIPSADFKYKIPLHLP